MTLRARSGKRALHMALLRELATACDLAIGCGWLAPAEGPERRAAALAWLPVVGLAIGGIAVAAALVAGSAGGVAAAIAGIGVLVLFDVRRSAIVLAGRLLGAIALALAPAPAAAVALLLTPMLGRWALVVQCYGGRPASGAEGLEALAGRARFREFGWASTTTLGVTLALADGVGLLVVVVCAAATLAVRALAYHRGTGIDARAIRTTSALVETCALVVLAAIGGVLGRRP